MDIPMTPFLVASPMNGLPTPVLAPCWLSSGSLWDAGHSDLLGEITEITVIIWLIYG